MSRVNVRALAISLGLVWSMAILLSGWCAPFGWCTDFVKMMSSVYIGFAPGFLGGIIGALWAFCDGALGGAILGWIYNFLADRF